MSPPDGIRLARTLRGHTNTIGRSAWSPDGRLLATPSTDTTIRVWDAQSGECLHLLQAGQSMREVAFDGTGTLVAAAGNAKQIDVWELGSTDPVASLPCGFRSNCVAFSPGSRILASGSDDGVVRVWDLETRALLRELPDHPRYVMGLAFRPNLPLLAVAAYDNTGGKSMTLWDFESGTPLFTKRDAGTVADVTFHPDGRLYSSDHEGTIKVWYPASGRMLKILEGHTDTVWSVSVSHDGRLLASRGRDGSVGFWDCQTGESLAILDEPAAMQWTYAAIFNPRSALLATSEGAVAHIWELDIEQVLGVERSSVTYTSAKIVLVGESGVGKTGLGWRLSHDEFKEHSSTHGQQFWMLDQLRHTRTDGTRCEAILWDLAGQPDYRLIHALFVDDADLALVLFDPTRDEDPLRGVEYWLRQLGIGQAREGSHRRATEAILVAARTDRGTGRLTDADIETYCKQRGIRGYISTSALSGDGLDDLTTHMRETLAWDESPITVTTATFKRIKDYVLALKQAVDAKQVILSPEQLRESLVRDTEGGDFTDEEMLKAVDHLSKHGYVTQLRTSRGETRILLTPDLLNNVAASIVLEARRNEKGLGSVEEELVLSGDYEFRELEDLSETDRDVLLDSAIAMFLDHNVCFRETDPLSSRVYIVFPELINLKKPAVDDEERVEETVAYTAVGQVENVYASLVVLLGYTNTFTRTHQWSDQARYVVGDGLVCGFRLEQEREGELDFVLYFGVTVGEPVRNLFQSLFESFLARRDLTIRRYEQVCCPNGHRLNRAVVKEQIASGEQTAFCSRCGTPTDLPAPDDRVELTHDHTGDVAAQRRNAARRSVFEQSLFRFKTYVDEAKIRSPNCFVSYAWGQGEHERWVEDQLATDLVKAGIAVVLDRWENAQIGASVPRFVERIANCDKVVVVGTPLYRQKYENGKPVGGFVVAAEGDLIGKRMMGSENEKRSILPIVRDGNDESSLPALLQGRVYADFRDPEAYFVTVFDLILSAYEIGPQDVVCAGLRQKIADVTSGQQRPR